MKDHTVEELVDMAQAFAKTDFGKWFLDATKQKKNELLDTAMLVDTHEEKVTYIDRASGVLLIESFITHLLELAEHPELIPQEKEKEGDMQQ